MSSVAMSNVASSRSCLSSKEIPQAKVGNGMLSPRSASSRNGLLSFNKIDYLHLKLVSKSTKRCDMSKRDSNDRRFSKGVICGHGMNMIFVGTEVSPWCKTGGLGDVLGGLPPAMAVCYK